VECQNAEDGWFLLQSLESDVTWNQGPIIADRDFNQGRSYVPIPQQGPEHMPQMHRSL
jgi:hypothetical protein